MLKTSPGAMEVAPGASTIPDATGMAVALPHSLFDTSLDATCTEAPPQDTCPDALGMVSVPPQGPPRPQTHLLVGKDEEDGVPQLILRQHPHQLLPRLVHPLPVVAVHHKDQPWGEERALTGSLRSPRSPSPPTASPETPTLGVLEVMPPEGPDLVLPTHIPHGEADVLVLHRLHVEPCGERQRRETEARGAASPFEGALMGSGLCSVPPQPHPPMVGMVVTISPSLSL